jgi:hypothetical protein
MITQLKEGSTRNNISFVEASYGGYPDLARKHGHVMLRIADINACSIPLQLGKTFLPMSAALDLYFLLLSDCFGIHRPRRLLKWDDAPARLPSV